MITIQHLFFSLAFSPRDLFLGQLPRERVMLLQRLGSTYEFDVNSEVRVINVIVFQLNITVVIFILSLTVVIQFRYKQFPEHDSGNRHV